MPSGVTRFTACALAACGVLAVAEVARVMGAAVPPTALVLLGSMTAVLAFTAAIRDVAFVWRGPVIVTFRRGDGVLCDARESAAVRAAASLRGTMGGAGHLYPRRLLFSAATWVATAAQALMLLLPDRGAATYLPFLWVLVGGALAARFPAIAFYYRETAGDCVVAFPVEVCERLLENARMAPTPRPMELAALGAPASPADAPAGARGAQQSQQRDEPSA